MRPAAPSRRDTAGRRDYRRRYRRRHARRRPFIGAGRADGARKRDTGCPSRSHDRFCPSGGIHAGPRLERRRDVGRDRRARRSRLRRRIARRRRSRGRSRLLGGALADVLASGEIGGKPNETSLIHAKDAPFKRVLAGRPGRPREAHAVERWRSTPAPRCAISASAASTTIAIVLPRRRRSRARRRRSSPRARSPATARHDDVPHRSRQAGGDRRRARSWPARSIARRSRPA